MTDERRIAWLENANIQQYIQRIRASWMQRPPLPQQYSRSYVDLEAVIEEFEQRTPRIVFFGLIKAGKSTLLNALIARPILPTRTNRATGVITRLYYGSPAAEVVFSGSSGTYKRSIALDDVASYILLDLDHGQSLAQENVDSVQVTLPAELLRGLEFVDTPGLQDTAQLSECSMAEIARADMAILVLSAVAIFSQEEQRAADQAQELLGGNLALVVNRFDQIDQEDGGELLAWTSDVTQHYGNRYVRQPRLFATAARQALMRNSAERGVSDVLALEAWLQELFAPPHGLQLILHVRLHKMEQALKKLRTAIQAIALQEKHAQHMYAAHAQAKMLARRNDDERLLAHLRAMVPLLTQSFVERSMKAIEPLFANDSWRSEASIRQLLEGQVKVMCEQFDEELKERATKLPQEYMPKLQTPAFSFTVATSHATTVGSIVGGILGSALSFGVGSAVGIGLGFQLGKLAAGDLRGQTLASVQAAIQIAADELVEQLARYIVKLEQSLALQYNLADSEPSARATYQSIQLWIQSFLQQLQTIRKQEGLL